MDQKETKTIKVNLDTHFWNSKYEENKIGWDIGYANPIHIEYVLEVFEKMVGHRTRSTGYKITKEPEFLRHFTSHFAPIG